MKEKNSSVVAQCVGGWKLCSLLSGLWWCSYEVHIETEIDNSSQRKGEQLDTGASQVLTSSLPPTNCSIRFRNTSR